MARQDLLLTDEEREAIDGDIIAFQKLRSRRWDTATPAGRTPRQIDAGRAFVRLTQSRCAPCLEVAESVSVRTRLDVSGG